jgi:hypothetical protein
LPTSSEAFLIVEALPIVEAFCPSSEAFLIVEALPIVEALRPSSEALLTVRSIAHRRNIVPTV